MPTSWSEKLKQAVELPGKFLANGGHAQQDIPAQHRLLNASGMFVGWWVMDKVRHAVFGVKMKSEGEYVEVPIEEVPAPLRFLHKAIDWDPHSETADNQWKKLAYQLFPGVGAGVGAAVGSIYAFNRNGREQMFKASKTQKVLSLLDADFGAQYAQSAPLRALTAFFGTFSAASGLTFLYGMFLNNAFMAANGAKMFTATGGLAKGNLAPHKAAEAQLGTLKNYIEAGKGDAWAEQFVTKVMQPMFGHELNTPELQAQAVKTLQGKAAGYLKNYSASKKPVAEKDKEFASKIATDLVQALHLDPKNAKLGNANPIVRGFHSFLSGIGLGSVVNVGAQPTAKAGFGYALPVLGSGAAAAGLMLYANSANAATEDTLPDLVASESEPTLTSASTDNNTPTPPAQSTTVDLSIKHPHPEAAGKTPAEYVADAMATHNTNNKGNPPALLKWMGDAQLAVLPTNRMLCAIGLTAGLMLAGNMSKIATGYGLDKKAVDLTKLPTYLKGMHKIIPDYNPNDLLKSRNRLIYYGQWAAYSLGGLLGIKAGTDFAYSNVKNKNKDPHYLEDYLPRVSMHQGETWSWLGAFSGIFGSSSGLFNLPVPGLNYALGLAGRATSMQDRNFMLGGLNGMMSGATTTSFLRLREGMNYLCHYAANNPAETPSQLEFLAYTMLGPIFKDQLTVAHIQRFTEAVHEVRDKYWQEGGIPKEKRKEALATMREVFTGAGLEVLLIDMGLNPGTIAFDQLNGMTGAIGNLGISNKIKTEQDGYHKALAEHLTTYVTQGLISQERADWVKAGIEAMEHGKKMQALAPTPKEALPTPSAEIPSDSKFADKAPHKNSIEELIQRSEKPGNWSEAAQLSKANLAPVAVGG